VVTAGLVSAIGWSLLVFYVITDVAGDTMITRDYVTYLTSNSVLIGAEISKIITLLLFTAILAIAVRRAHSFLVTSIAEGTAAKDLARFMPDAVAETIRDADHEISAGEGARGEAAIMNVDIRGFTSLTSEMEPADAMALLSDYQHQIVPIVHAHHGVIDKFMGDGIMITFGASSNDPKYCANALRCADAIIASKAKWTGPAASVTINLAVAAGPVISGAVGDGDRLEFTVIGSTVNRSAKLEKYNKRLGTTGLCDRETYELARRQGYEIEKPNRHRNVVIEGENQPSDLVVLG